MEPLLMTATDALIHAHGRPGAGASYPLPAYDTPRSRLNDMGPAALSEVEVVSLVLGGAPEKALTEARLLLSRFGGLHGLLRANVSELVQEQGIGPARAAQLKAALELGRRLLLAPPGERLQVRSPEDVAALLMVEMGHLDQEQLRVLLLDTRHQLIRQVVVYVGSVNTSLVRVGEVFKEAVRENAAAIVVVHSHPSGSPEPSVEDYAVTKEIVAAGRLLSCEVLDHLIIGWGQYVSLRERGLGFGK
jgi:DNA repair protein RadC